MSHYVTLPDGRVIEAPDTVSRDQVMRDYGFQAEARAEVTPPAELGDGERLWRSLQRGTVMAYDDITNAMPRAFMPRPPSAAEAIPSQRLWDAMRGDTTDTLGSLIGGATSPNAPGPRRSALPSNPYEDSRAVSRSRAALAERILPGGARGIDYLMEQSRKGNPMGGAMQVIGENLLQSAPTMLPTLAAMAATGGAVAPAVAAGTPAFIGSNINRADDSGSSELTGDEQLRSVVAAPGQAALDALIGKFIPGVRGNSGTAVTRAGRGFASRTALGITGGAATEAVTETAQQVGERWAAGLPLLDEEALDEYRESAAIGGLTGGAMAVGSGFGSRRAATEQDLGQYSEAPEGVPADLLQRGQLPPPQELLALPAPAPQDVPRFDASALFEHMSAAGLKPTKGDTAWALRVTKGVSDALNANDPDAAEYAIENYSQITGPATTVERRTSALVSLLEKVDELRTLDAATAPSPSVAAPASQAAQAGQPLVGTPEGEIMSAPQADQRQSAFQQLLQEEKMREQSERAQRELQFQEDVKRADDTTAARHAILDEVLGDPETRNPTGRFISRLREEGITDRSVREDEADRISRYTDVKQAFDEGYAAAQKEAPVVDEDHRGPTVREDVTLGVKERKDPKAAQPEPEPTPQPKPKSRHAPENFELENYSEEDVERKEAALARRRKRPQQEAEAQSHLASTKGAKGKALMADTVAAFMNKGASIETVRQVASLLSQRKYGPASKLVASLRKDKPDGTADEAVDAKARTSTAPDDAAKPAEGPAPSPAPAQDSVADPVTAVIAKSREAADARFGEGNSPNKTMFLRGVDEGIGGKQMTPQAEINKWGEARKAAYKQGRAFVRAARAALDEPVEETVVEAPAPQEKQQKVKAPPTTSPQQVKAKETIPTIDDDYADVSEIARDAYTDGVISGPEHDRFARRIAAARAGAGIETIEVIENSLALTIKKNSVAKLVQNAAVTRRDMLRAPLTLAAAATATRAKAAPSSIREAIVQTESIEGALRWITANSKNALYRLVANKLLLGGFGDKVTLVWGPSTKASYGHAIRNDQGGVDIFLNDGTFDAKDGLGKINGMEEETVLHEAIHAYLLVRFHDLNFNLPANRDMLGTRASDPFVDRFMGLSNTLRALAKSGKLDNYAGYKLADAMANRRDINREEMSVWAGVNDADELLVRVLTDPDLQAFLKKFDLNGNPATSGNSWWDRFVAWVRDVLGMPKEAHRTAFNDLLDAGLSVLDAAALDPADRKVSDRVAELTSLDNKASEKGMYVGQKSLTADPDMLNLAQVGAKFGHNREHIRKTTGWHEGLEGMWRYEIDDSAAELTDDVKDNMPDLTAMRLDEVLQHDKLYEAYPQAADIPVVFRDLKPKHHGEFDPILGRININKNDLPSEQRETVLHEVQHWVQKEEGFSTGANDNTVPLGNKRLLMRVRDHLQGKLERGETRDDGGVGTFNLPRTSAVNATLKAIDAVLPLANQFAPLDAALLKIRKAVVANKGWTLDTSNAWDAVQRERKALIELAGGKDAVQPIMDTLYLRAHGEREAFDTGGRSRLTVADRVRVPPNHDLAPDEQVWLSDTGRLAKRLETFNDQDPTTEHHRLASQSNTPAAAAKNVTNTFKHALRTGVLHAAFTEDLLEGASKIGMKSSDDYGAAMNEKRALQTRLEERNKQVLLKFETLDSQATRDAVNKFLHQSTLQGKWGYVPQYLSGRVIPDPVMQARYKALTPAGQEVVRMVFEYGYNTLKAKKEGVIAAIKDNYAHQITEAAADNDPAKITRLERRRDDSLAHFASLMSTPETTPYAPLRRFGDTVVIGMSAEYKDAEKAEDTKRMRALKQDPAHYFVDFAENDGEGRKMMERLVAKNPQFSADKGGYADYYGKDKTRDFIASDTDMFLAFQRLQKTLDPTMFDTKSNYRETQRVVTDLYLTALSQASARKSEMRRLGVASEDLDMMRAFATQGLADAHFVAHLHKNGDVLDAIDGMEREASSRDEGSMNDRRAYLNEIKLRHTKGMETQASALTDAILRATSLYMLAFSPAYYIQNSTQTAMLTAPYMAGKHGYGRVISAITKAYKDVAPLVKAVKLHRPLEIKGLPSDVEQAVRELTDSGRIDIGLAFDIGSWAASGNGKFSQRWNAVDRGVRNMLGKVEMINRLTAAIAAYRLERQRGATHEQAVKYADKTVRVTHGTYDGFNAPRFMRGGIGRVITQFRKFQLIQISLLARLWHEGFKGEDKHTRAAARAALMFTVGQTALFTGMMGLPAYGLLAPVVAALIGDPDEPDDLEQIVREATGNSMLSTLLTRGVPNLAGVDLSGKIGMGNAFSLLPFLDKDPTTEEGAKDAVVQAMGPAVSVGLRYAQGMDMLRQGDYVKSLERMLPNGLSHALRAARERTEGVTTRGGKLVLRPEDIDAISTFWEAMGFSSTEKSVRGFEARVQMRYGEFLKKRSVDLYREYREAIRNDETGRQRELEREWLKFQEMRMGLPEAVRKRLKVNERVSVADFRSRARRTLEEEADLLDDE